MSPEQENEWIGVLSVNVLSPDQPPNYFDRLPTELHLRIYTDVLHSHMIAMRPPQGPVPRPTFRRNLMSLVQVCQRFRRDAHSLLWCLLKEELELCQRSTFKKIPSQDPGASVAADERHVFGLNSAHWANALLLCMAINRGIVLYEFSERAKIRRQLRDEGRM
ncbi:hypothetical protein LTR95_011979 [Oleoguttula sp. CCFEE 5521]